MKKLILMLLTVLMTFVASVSFAAPIQPNQLTVKGLSMSSSMEQVEKVMGKPYRIGHYYMESYWGGYNDIMYEYPGVNFVFKTGYGATSHPMLKIILDAPQVSLDNGLKVGIPLGTVAQTLGTDYKFINGEVVYDCIIDPVTYETGKLTFVVEGKTVTKILIEKQKG